MSNITLVMAIKKIGSTLTAVFGAMEPLTAVLIGVLFLHEELHLAGIAGIVLILSAVMVATRQKTGSETKPHNSNP